MVILNDEMVMLHIWTVILDDEMDEMVILNDEMVMLHIWTVILDDEM
nr:hypothetical protein [Tanacetum cinerariifolium]